MRIAFLVRRFPALSETFVLNQITGLLDRGHDVDIFAEAPGDTLAHPDVARYGLAARTRYWPALPRTRPQAWLKGLSLLVPEALAQPRVLPVVANVSAYGRQGLNMRLAYAAWPFRHGLHYDVIQCHFGPLGMQGQALRDMGLLTGRLVTAFHGYDLSRNVTGSATRRYARLFDRGDLFLPISDRWRKRLLELGCPADRIAVHRMGIDPRQFALRARPPASTLRLVSVARLVEKKGIEVAIRAVAMLVEAGRRIAYTVIGDGPLAPDLARLVAELRLHDIVRFGGKRLQPEVIAALDDAHIIVVPSVVARDGDEEGIPVVLMEAMAMGLPVVASRHSGIPELVEDGVSGVLVPEGDADALAKAIGSLADMPERWASMGEAGRARVLAAHDIEALNDALAERYRRLTA